MSITIDLPTEAEAGLRKKAKAKGIDFSEFLENILQREANIKPMSFSESARPLRNWTNTQGYCEEEIEDLVDEAVSEVRREKRPLNQ